MFFRIYKLFHQKRHQNMYFNSLNLSIHSYSDLIWSVFLMCNPTCCLSAKFSGMFCLHFLISLLAITLTCMSCSSNFLYISLEKRSMCSIFSLPFADLYSYIVFSHAALDVRSELRRIKKIFQWKTDSIEQNEIANKLSK